MRFFPAGGYTRTLSGETEAEAGADEDDVVVLLWLPLVPLLLPLGPPRIEHRKYLIVF